MANITALQPIAKQELFPYLSGMQLLNLCQTNQAFRQICQDEAIWESKVRSEFPDFYKLNYQGKEWRKYYIDIAYG